GPGRDQDDRLVALSLFERIRRGDFVAHRPNARAEPLQRFDDIEGEAVMVVDHQHVAAHRTDSPAIAERTAEAFRRVSSASAIGSESWTTPAPARTYAVPSFTSAERMITPVSSSPSPLSQPIAPPSGPCRLRSSL